MAAKTVRHEDPLLNESSHQLNSATLALEAVMLSKPRALLASELQNHNRQYDLSALLSVTTLTCAARWHDAVQKYRSRSHVTNFLYDKHQLLWLDE